jgi:hypothetical protein
MPSNMAVLSHRSIPPKIYSILESFTLWDFRYCEINLVKSSLP